MPKPPQEPDARPQAALPVRGAVFPRSWKGKEEALTWFCVCVALVLFHLSNPLTWGRSLPGWWFPPAGLGLVLMAWLGPRAILLILADSLLVAFQVNVADTPVIWGDGWPTLLGSTWDAVILAGEILAAWEYYRFLAHGARQLGDPRSATLFLLIVPTFILGLFSVLHTLPFWFVDSPILYQLAQRIAHTWLSHALGIMVLAPPLLATLTPWLVRCRIARSEPPQTSADTEPPPLLSRAHLLEITGLTCSLAVLGVLQAFVHRDQEFLHWQLWGLPLLVIAWASLRHGLRGGTLVASSAAGLQLLMLGFLLHDVPPDPFWQGNLLTQCGTALLIAAAANWIRLSEARHRQVVTRIPVILYSARVAKLPVDNRSPPLALLTFVSPAARNLLGLDPQDLLGDYSHWLSLVHPEDHEVLTAALVQLRRQQDPVTCEYRLALPRNFDGPSSQRLATSNLITRAVCIRLSLPREVERPPRRRGVVLFGSATLWLPNEEATTN